MTTFREHIERAVELAGSQRALAKKVGLSQQGISWLLRDASNVSAEIAVKIEGATEGKVSRRHLRPDLFGEEAA